MNILMLLVVCASVVAIVLIIGIVCQIRASRQQYRDDQLVARLARSIK